MIRNIQNNLGDVNWRKGYLNAGVIVASKQHKEVFNTSLEEINRVQSIEGIITPEQDYLNYMIRKLKFKVHKLDYKFNHIRYYSFDRFDSYIIHYAGSHVFDEDLRIKKIKRRKCKQRRKLTTIQMKRDWKKIKRNNKK